MIARPGHPLLVTAEHGGNAVPPEHAALFRGRSGLLDSHRGWDPGTMHLARWLARRLDAPLVASDVTRLLVDLNRSPHNPRVFSEVTRALPRAERDCLLDRWHRPHWDAVRTAVEKAVTERGRVLHLAVHSFTPTLDGAVRTMDVALLYDPGSTAERELAVDWSRALAATLPSQVIRRNDPYRGSADGLTTSLRKLYHDNEYMGVEVEVNQKHVGKGGRFPGWVGRALVDTLPLSR